MQFLNDLQSMLEQKFTNPYILGIVKLLIILYSCLVAPTLPVEILAIFDVADVENSLSLSSSGLVIGIWILGVTLIEGANILIAGVLIWIWGDGIAIYWFDGVGDWPCRFCG